MRAFRARHMQPEYICVAGLPIVGAVGAHTTIARLGVQRCLFETGSETRQ